MTPNNTCKRTSINNFIKNHKHFLFFLKGFFTYKLARKIDREQLPEKNTVR